MLLGEGKTTPLMRASSRGHDSIVDLLIARGADVNAGLADHRRPPLEHAARGGDFGIFTALLRARARLAEPRKDGDTLLHLAARNGEAELIELIARDFPQDIEARNVQGETPLGLAVWGKNSEGVEALLELGARCAKEETSTGLSLLALAATRDDSQLLEHLLAGGASLDDPSVVPAVRLAARHCSAPALRVLLAAPGAAESIAQPHPLSLLHEAAAFDNAEGCRFLIEEGGCETDRSSLLTGRTALHYAELLGSSSSASVLKGAGADQGRADRLGWQASDYRESRARAVGVPKALTSEQFWKLARRKGPEVVYERVVGPERRLMCVVWADGLIVRSHLEGNGGISLSAAKQSPERGKSLPRELEELGFFDVAGPGAWCEHRLEGRPLEPLVYGYASAASRSGQVAHLHVERAAPGKNWIDSFPASMPDADVLRLLRALEDALMEGEQLRLSGLEDTQEKIRGRSLDSFGRGWVGTCSMGAPLTHR